MTSPSVTTKWVEAGKALAVDSHRQIMCPVNADAFLVVTDVSIEGSNKFERIMECPNCGARNILLMTK